MEFTTRFLFERELSLWFADFMGRALPGRCYPEEIVYDIRTEREAGRHAYRILATLAMDDGEVDVAASIDFDEACERRDGGMPGFADVEATWDVRDPAGDTVETRVWCDPANRWVEVEDPRAMLSIIDGGSR